MKRVFKFAAPLSERTIVMPRGARVLTVQIQHGQPYIWALCDALAIEEQRSFEWFGTGQILTEKAEQGKYIGAVQIDRSVFHLFEVAP